MYVYTVYGGRVSGRVGDHIMYCRTFTLSMWPDSEPVLLLTTWANTKNLGGPQQDEQLPSISFCRLLLRRRDIALPSMNIIILWPPPSHPSFGYQHIVGIPFKSIHYIDWEKIKAHGFCLWRVGRIQEMSWNNILCSVTSLPLPPLSPPPPSPLLQQRIE